MSDHARDVVDTAQGTVQGIVNPDGMRIFRGIPFAAPPTGELRLKRSVPHAGWDGVLDCTEYRACSLQPTYPGVDVNALYPGGLDEDCLHLNVWVPDSASAKSALPVYVWIHGGGYTAGSGSEPTYEGSRLAQEGLVVVTVNYRLGALGFMWPDDGDANCALWDQVRALEWVGENIASFGGDPDNVTIGGESAGAGCSTCLAASPIANKLFHRAVIMSTVAQCTDDERTAKIRSTQFARALGAASINVTDFAGFSGIEFVAAQVGIKDEAPDEDFAVAHNTPGWQGPSLPELSTGYTPAEADGIHYVIPGEERDSLLGSGFHPVVDGELLPGHPLDLIADGGAAHISILVGSNREETGFRVNPADAEITAPLTYGAKVDSLDDAARRAHWFFMGWGRLEPLGGGRAVAENLVNAYYDAEADGSGAAEKGSPQHVWNRLASDLAFNASTVMVAARQAMHRDDTYTYRFDGFNNRNAFHGWELGLKFGTILNKSNEEVVRFARSMRSAIADFVKTGDPNGAENVPAWPAWSIDDGLNGPVMHFDKVGNHVDGYQQAAPAIDRVIEVIDTAFPHSSIT
jgi:para-nitrobenzyl esterase